MRMHFHDYFTAYVLIQVESGKVLIGENTIGEQ